MKQAARKNTPPPHPAAGKHAPQTPPAGRIIAIIGCDGAGKSTIAADLYAKVQKQQPDAELHYLGQDSGNILRAILTWPLIGSAIGRYLVKRSQKAHGSKEKSATPDTLTALVVHLLSRWRRHKFKHMLALSERGITIVTDRYPQAEVPGFYFDGPGLTPAKDMNGFVRWLARREQRLYEQMARHVPDLLIRLNIDADTAYARKPDHKLSMLQDKVRVIPKLGFNGAKIIDLDSTQPYDTVLAKAWDEVQHVMATGAGATGADGIVSE